MSLGKDKKNAKTEVSTSLSSTLSLPQSLARPPKRSHTRSNDQPLIETKDALIKPKIVPAWSNVEAKEVAGVSLDLSSITIKLTRLHYGAVLKTQEKDRKSHSLFKGTLKAIGPFSDPILNLCKMFDIKITEDQGDEIQQNKQLLEAFTNEGLNKDWNPRSPQERIAVQQLSDLHYFLVNYNELGRYLDSSNVAQIYVRFHQIKHIQKIIFSADVHSYISQSRVGSDRKNELNTAVMSWFGSSIATNLYLDLIEKIIEAFVVNESRDKEKTNKILSAHRTSFIGITKAYERTLPLAQKKTLKPNIQRQLSRNPKLKLKETDYNITNTVHRPVLDTTGFLTTDEKSQLAALNRELNEFGAHIPDLISADGSARRAYITSISSKHSSNVSAVNRTIRTRKSAVHSIMIGERKANNVPNKDANGSLIPFSKEEWRNAFDLLDKSDLQLAITTHLCLGENNFSMTKYCQTLASFPPNADLSINISSSEDDRGANNMSTEVTQ
jgi:hypothetical protein